MRFRRNREPTVHDPFLWNRKVYVPLHDGHDAADNSIPRGWMEKSHYDVQSDCRDDGQTKVRNGRNDVPSMMTTCHLCVEYVNM